MQKYIDKIKNEEIKKNVQEAYNKLPEYFHTVAASSTGKYHPKFSLGDGGLKRHTSCAVDIALQLFILPEYHFNDFTKDCIIGAIILHDGMKHGEPGTKSYNERYTVKIHDDIMSDWLEKFWVDLFEGRGTIVNCIRSHMGQWATSENPETDEAKFVHLCDYLASRKLWDKYYSKEVEEKQRLS